MRLFTTILAILFTIIFIVGCKNAELSMSEQVPLVSPPPTTPPPTTETETPPNEDPPVEPATRYRYYNDTFRAPRSMTKLDILFCVDNSTSMSEEQRRLGRRFNSFISAIRDFDYQIGFVTSDMSGNGPTQGGQLLKVAGTSSYILRSGDSGQNNKFKNTIQRPEVGNGDERCIYSLITALNNNEYGIIRSDADLGIIIISDENERSNGNTFGYPLEAGKDRASDLIDTARRIKGDQQVTVHAIVVDPGPPVDSKCLQEQAAQGTNATPYYGHEYAAAARVTGGRVGSVCADDYATQLEEISRTLVRTTSSIDLKCTPDLSGGPVRVEGFTEDEYKVEGSKIIFNPPLMQDTRVTYSYWCRN